MKPYFKKISLGVACLLVLIGVVLALYLFRSKQEAASFAEELSALKQAETELLTENSDISREEALQSLEAIQQLYEKKNQAWCDGKADAFASVYTENADYISFDGTHTVGRDDIQSSHEELFENFVQDTCLVGEIKKIRFLSKDAAVFQALGGTVFDSSGIARRPSIQTFTAVRNQGQWQFTSFHNGRVDKVGDRNMFRLMWLGIQTFMLRR